MVTVQPCGGITARLDDKALQKGGTMKKVISKYFNNSYLSAVSSLVKEEDISLEDLKQLIAEVERGKI